MRYFVVYKSAADVVREASNRGFVVKPIYTQKTIGFCYTADVNAKLTISHLARVDGTKTACLAHVLAEALVTKEDLKALRKEAREWRDRPNRLPDYTVTESGVGYQRAAT
jgi:hypothetical protein